jgi:hypothetical protein
LYDGYQIFMMDQLSNDPREEGSRIEGDSLCDSFLDTLVMSSCGCQLRLGRIPQVQRRTVRMVSHLLIRISRKRTVAQQPGNNHTMHKSID